MGKQNYNEEEIRKTLGIITDGWKYLTEIRVLEGKQTYTNTYGKELLPHRTDTYYGYFDNCDDVIKSLKQIPEAKGVYYMLNPIKPDLISREASNKLLKAGKGDTTSDRDILERHWMLVDLDTKKDAKVSATQEEVEYSKKKAIKVGRHLKEKGFKDPIMSLSGNGTHLLFRINEAVDDGGIIEQTLKTINEKFEDEKVSIDTGVFNPARISRLYGTTACKGSSTESNGRIHRNGKILWKPETMKITDTSTIASLTGWTRQEKQPVAQQEKTIDRAIGGEKKEYSDKKILDFPLEEWFKENNINFTDNGRKDNYTIYEIDVCPFRPDHTAYVHLYDNGQPAFKCFHTGDCPANVPSRVGWADFYGRFGSNWSNDKQKWSLGTLDPKPQTVQQAAAFPEVEEWDNEPVILTKPKPRQLTEECVPEILWNYGNEISTKINTPLDFAIVSAISALSSSIGRKYHIRPVDHFRIYCNQFTLLVGESSMNKSSAMDFAIQPIKDKYKEYIKDYKQKLKDQDKAKEDNQEEIDTKKKEINRLETSTLNVAVEKVFEMQDTYDKIKTLEEEIINLENIPEISKKYYYVDDVSEAALCNALISSPNGILLYCDEANTLFSSFHQTYNQSLQSLLLKAWNSDKDHTVLRKSGDAYIPFLSASLLGSIQDDVFAKFISHSTNISSGFIPRCQLIVYGEEDSNGRYKRNKKPLDNNIIRKYYKVVEKIIDCEPPLDNLGGIMSCPLTLTDKAQEVWEVYHEELMNFIKDSDLGNGLKSHFKKYDFFVPGLAMTYHFVEDPECKSRKVSETNMVRAIKTAEVLATHAYKAYNLGSAESNNLNCQIEVLNKIKYEVDDGNINVRVIKKKMKAKKYGNIVANIQELVDDGWVRINKVAGTRSETVEINPLFEETYENGEIEYEEADILPDFMELYEEWKIDQANQKRIFSK